MDIVKVALGGREGYAGVASSQVCKFAEEGAGFVTLNKLGVLGDVSEVFVVVETTVAKEMVDLV